MARQPKLYKIKETKSTRAGTREYFSSVGTVAELVQAYGYTLEVGQSWQHEQGNKKINRNPKSIAVLLKNLYNAKNNSAGNGWSGSSFESVEVTEDEKSKYKEQLKEQ